MVRQYSDIWKHLKPEERSEDNAFAGESNTNPRVSAAELEPCGQFRRSDWARNGISAKLNQMSRSRREKHYATARALAHCWPMPRAELLWMGGKYARHPRHFPEHQNEHAWVYVHLRPLGIQPDPFLFKLRQQSKHYTFAPADIHHLPGTLPDSMRAGKLWTYMETHKLHKSLWYGHALRNKRKHHTSILDHPLQDVRLPEHKSFVPQPRPFHHLAARSPEEVSRMPATLAIAHDEEFRNEASDTSDHRESELRREQIRSRGEETEDC